MSLIDSDFIIAEMLQLFRSAMCYWEDSGGISKECYWMSHELIITKLSILLLGKF